MSQEAQNRQDEPTRDRRRKGKRHLCDGQIRDDSMRNQNIQVVTDA
jgi:hypothetical protein